MKFVLLLVATCVVVAWGKPAGTYTDKWDHIKVEEILESDRLMKGYVDCLMDMGRCTPDGKALKETLPDALENGCNKCTEKQRSGSEKVLRNLINKRTALWKQLATKYDPENIYQEKYKDKIESVKGKE